MLVLQLKRFELSTNNGNYQWKKLSHNVDFPVRDLDLRDLLSPSTAGTTTRSLAPIAASSTLWILVSDVASVSTE